MQPLLSRKQIDAQIKTLPGWRRTRAQIRREYTLADFKKALQFANKVGRIAEKHAHHPEISIDYNRVTLTLSTHSQGGLTSLDFQLAAEIEKVAIGSSTL